MRSDRAQGAFWILVGGAIFYASWTMDRLANVGVQPYSAPGLLPGILGVFIAVLGVGMLFRRETATGEAIEWRRLVLPIALCLGFAAGMVGRGLPFWLAAWIFIAAMIWTLQYRERKGRKEHARLAAISLSVGLVASVAISLVFQELFLIRLP
ncbi:MAG TPA: tripartite tricarboxylate transporter TctB family protein [Burkholderiales bacterium]|nr:tripartite tricarboxylate transporter TctB family protein [Burkholderiales bacterium]